MIAGAIWVTALQGQQQKLSLQQAIAKALENNYQVQVTDLDLRIARNNNNWGTVGAFPGIDVGATNVNRYEDGRQQKAATHSLAPYVSLNYMIFNGFSARISKEKLAELEHLSEGNARLVIENTLQAVVLAYYRALLAREQVKVLEEVKDLSSDRYAYEQQQKALGTTGTFEVLQAKTAYLSDSSNLILQKNNYRNALRNLNQLMAEEVGASYEITGTLTPSYEQYNLQELEQKMLADNRNLQNQFINEEILKKNVNIEKSALYPSLRLNSGIDYSTSRVNSESTPASTSDSYAYYANFTLSFNLFDGGNTRRAIQNAEIEKMISAVETEEMTNRQRRNLRDTFELYEVRKQLFDVAVENEEAARLNMQIAEERFKAGAINSFNYRDIQLAYLNTALSKLQAVYNLIDAQTELMRLTGNIVSEY
jgi:outer membrane protein TolC